MQEISQEQQQYYYYKVPLKQSNREKHIFFISEESDSNIQNYAQKSVQQYILKNKLNWLVSIYDFKKHLRNIEYSYATRYSDYYKLDQELTYSEKTLIEFYKNYIPLYQKKFGTHKELQIQNGNYFIVKKQRFFHYFIHVPQEQANFTDLKNQFNKINSRCNIFFVNIGNYDLKKHSFFASAIQKNYSTEKLTHKLCYTYEQYFSGKDLEFYDQNQQSFIAKAIEDIIPDLNFHEILEVQVDVQQYPWSQLSKQVIRGSYVISKEDHGEQIEFKNNSSEYLVKERQLDVDEMLNIFSTWVNDLLVNYGLGEIDKNLIQKAINFLSNQMNMIVSQINIASIPLNKPVENMTVRQRLVAQQSNRARYNMVVLIKSLSNLLTKDTICELKDEEERERIKIGTEVGKFHQRALAMKGIDVEAFQKMKNFFIEELLKVKSTISYESDQEKSIFSLENMKDVFQKEDTIEGLKDVKSQYHLISAFPLIGLGVKVQRSDGSMINPYLVQILDIARINANVDTISIQNTPDKELNLNAGFYMGALTGQRIWYTKFTEYQPKKQVLDEIFQEQLFYYNKRSEKLIEKIDAVVPLFGPKDYDLKPLLSTQFFHVLINFNVMHNVDTSFSECYLALLANLLLFLLNQEKSSYVTELMDKIYHSMKIFYGERPFFKAYCQMLMTSQDKQWSPITKGILLNVKILLRHQLFCFIFTKMVNQKKTIKRLNKFWNLFCKKQFVGVLKVQKNFTPILVLLVMIPLSSKKQNKILLIMQQETQKIPNSSRNYESC
ncbi:hypothetical protein ABPG72_009123 [Tetrahymena utriculariae]